LGDKTIERKLPLSGPRAVHSSPLAKHRAVEKQSHTAIVKTVKIFVLFISNPSSFKFKKLSDFSP
jgi:hypothetical protein